MINPQAVIEGYTFPQKPMVFHLSVLDGKMYAVPSMMLGNFTAVFSTDEHKQPDVIAPTHRLKIKKYFKILPNSEQAFKETAELNLANTLIAFVNNMFVGENLLRSLNSTGSPNINEMKQDFINFIALLCNESYRSGTHLSLVSDETRTFVASVISQTGATDLLYDIMPFIPEGVSQFVNTYLEGESVDSEISDDDFDFALGDDDLDFLTGLNDNLGDNDDDDNHSYA